MAFPPLPAWLVSRYLLFLSLIASAIPATATTAPTATPIYTIQGNTATSPFTDQRVSTRGVVTQRVGNGFFIQDPAGDDDPATSDGIFVFTGNAPPATAALGHLVQVTGKVTEFVVPGRAGAKAAPRANASTLTEIRSVSALQHIDGSHTIAPTLVDLPLAEGDSLERFEGMLVRFKGMLTVEQNYFLSRYGQLTLGRGRHETPTNAHRPGSVEAIALADLQARSRFLLDDGSARQNPNPTPHLRDRQAPRAGDAVFNLVGALDQGPAGAAASNSGLYRLHPTEAPVFAVANPRPAAPPTVGGQLRIGSMNLLNYFTTFTDGSTASGQVGQGCTLGWGAPSTRHCRGADSRPEFERQRAKLVQAITRLDADAVGLVEVQNNGDVAVRDLVEALNARAGANTYAVVPAPAQGTGTDAIRVAMVYKPARLSRVGPAASDPAAINHRPPLAQTFAARNGERFTLVVNHLKSKRACPSPDDAQAQGNLDTGDGQGCWNAQRIQQVQRLRQFLARVQANGGADKVLLVGDFNAYAKEDPIHHLTRHGFVDLSSRFDKAGYSFVFDGAAGRLDHALASTALAAQVTGTAHWHIGADESPQQDYNLEFKPPACAACAPDPFDPSGPSRASDHDPVLVGLRG